MWIPLVLICLLGLLGYLFIPGKGSQVDLVVFAVALLLVLEHAPMWPTVHMR